MSDRRNPLPDRADLADTARRIRCAVPGCDHHLNAKVGGHTVLARGALPITDIEYTNSGFMQPGEKCLLWCWHCDRDLEPFLTGGAASRTDMSEKERDYWESAARRWPVAGVEDPKSQPEVLTEAEEAFFSQERIPCAVSGCDQRFSPDDLRVDLTLRGTVPPRVRVDSEEGQPVRCALPGCDRETRGLEWFDVSQCVRYADRGLQRSVLTSWIEDHPEVTLGTDLETGKDIDVSLERLCSGCYILGVQGVGKSTLLEQIFIWRPYTVRDTPLRGDEDELKWEMSYERWADYVLNHDGIIWGTRTSRLWFETKKRVENPRLGFDYDIVPDYPKRDFGAGEVTFNPAWAQEALQVLNLLLYEAQKAGIGCAPLDDAETQLSPAQYRQYQENLSKAQKLDGLLGLILRFDDRADAAAAAETEEQYRQLLLDTAQGKQPRNVIESCHRLFTWRAELQACVAALVREPITQGASGVGPADVALSLQRLPSRQAYVRIGTVAHVMTTREMAPGVDAEKSSIFVDRVS